MMILMVAKVEKTMIMSEITLIDSGDNFDNGDEDEKDGVSHINGRKGSDDD